MIVKIFWLNNLIFICNIISKRESYERKRNEGIEIIFNRPNIQNCPKDKRLEWVDHVWRTTGKLIHKILINKISEKRLRNKPRQRWLDRVFKDILESLGAKRMGEAVDRSGKAACELNNKNKIIVNSVVNYTVYTCN